MNPQSDEYMDIDRYNSFAKVSQPEFGGFTTSKKKETVKKSLKVSNLIIKADLIATVALVTAVVGPSIISEQFEELFSPISCQFVETIAETNEIDYYLSIDSLEKTLGNVELRVSSTNYNQTFEVQEGKNIGEIKGLNEGTSYTISLYDGDVLVKKTEVKTITEEERTKRAWRKFFENFFNIYYDKEEDLLNIKMKIVDDLDRYEWFYISISDENEGYTFYEFNPENMNELQQIGIRSNEVYGKELHIMIVGYLKFLEGDNEEYMEEHEDFLYEGIFMLDEEYNPEPTEIEPEPVIESDVVAELADIIPGMNEISYCYLVGNTSLAKGDVYLEVYSSEYDVRTYELVEGKNIGTITDLEYASKVVFNVHDGDNIINSTEVWTLTEDELANRNITKFYPNFLDIYYDFSSSSLNVIMKVIDDNGYYGGYRIDFIHEETEWEEEISFEPEEANDIHSIEIDLSDMTGFIIIKFYAYMNNYGTSVEEQELCVVSYNIMEGTYETN